MGNRRYIEKNDKDINKKLLKIKELDFAKYSDEEIKEYVIKLKNKAEETNPENLVAPLFAAAKEATYRTLGLKLYDSQLITALALAKGRIVELPTGEGKTLSAALAASFFALSGKGVHILTFNDYLSKRDALWMKPIYKMLGLSVSYIDEKSNIEERKKAYDKDITYITAKEAGFDYLKRFLAYNKDELVQRNFFSAIVDEADSIMLDESRVPLVLAGDVSYKIEIDTKIRETVSKFLVDEDYFFDEYKENVAMTEQGIAKIEETLNIDNLYQEENAETIAKINIVLQAEFLLKKDVDYIVRDGKIQIVDEFTGRVVNNREWPDGVQAAVEQKEGLKSNFYGRIMNKITLRDFLSLYENLCGMTGTAATSAEQFYSFYNKKTVVVRPEKQCIRIDKADYIFKDKKKKLIALEREIKRIHKSGRPILVGTVSVEESETLAEMLKEDIPEVSVLNAKNNEEEALIIAEAGGFNSVTISTNMAGRGVDIRLGGSTGTDEEKVKKLGGLFVIGTNRHDSRRIDNQLRGRAGRQGDPGETQFFISLEDSIFEKYKLSEYLTPGMIKENNDGRIEGKAVHKAILDTQKISEGQNIDASITLSKYSELVEDERKVVSDKREKIFSGESNINVLEKNDSAFLDLLISKISKEEYEKAKRKIELYAINYCWADYLMYVENAMDEVKMIGQLGGRPLDLFSGKLLEAYDNLEFEICNKISEIFHSVQSENGKFLLDDYGIKGPSSTRTYLVTDGTENNNLINEFAVSVNPMSASLYFIYLFSDFLKKKTKEEPEQF